LVDWQTDAGAVLDRRRHLYHAATAHHRGLRPGSTLNSRRADLSGDRGEQRPRAATSPSWNSPAACPASHRLNA
jgi:hypothetical protein